MEHSANSKTKMSRGVSYWKCGDGLYLFVHIFNFAMDCSLDTLSILTSCVSKSDPVKKYAYLYNACILYFRRNPYNNEIKFWGHELGEWITLNQITSSMVKALSVTPKTPSSSPSHIKDCNIYVHSCLARRQNNRVSEERWYWALGEMLNASLHYGQNIWSRPTQV